MLHSPPGAEPGKADHDRQLRRIVGARRITQALLATQGSGPALPRRCHGLAGTRTGDEGPRGPPNRHPESPSPEHTGHVAATYPAESLPQPGCTHSSTTVLNGGVWADMPFRTAQHASLPLPPRITMRASASSGTLVSDDPPIPLSNCRSVHKMLCDPCPYSSWQILDSSHDQHRLGQ